MERLASDHKPVQDFSPITRDIKQLVQKKKAEAKKKVEFEIPNIVFNDAKNISIEYAFASGGDFPEYENLLALYCNGYLAHLPQEILQASECEDIQEFQHLIEPWYKDELSELESAKQKLLDEAQTKLNEGTLPPQIFKKVIFADKKGKISDEDVNDTVKLKRYTRWQILEKFTNKESAETVHMTKDSKLEMVLSMRLKSGGGVGFPHQLIDNSNGRISLANVEQAASELGYFDYAYPEIMQKIQGELIKAGEPVFGLNQDLREIYKFNPREAYVDTKNKTLLIGQTALKLVFSTSGSLKPYKRSLAKLLAEASHEYTLVQPNNSRHSHLTRDDYLNYGNWLLQLVEQEDGKLANKVIRTSYRLGLGPGISALTKDFSTPVKFFRELDFEGRSRYGLFKDWEFDDFVKHLQAVEAEIGRRPTIQMLWQRIRDGFDEPSPQMMKQVAPLREIFAAAGQLRYLTRTPEELIDAGLHFFDTNSRLPDTKDLRRPPMPSGRQIYANFKNIAAYRKVLQDIIETRQGNIAV